jgi:hypothetical protein
MASTATVLAWGLVDCAAGYSRAGMHIVVKVKMQTQNVRFSTKDVASSSKGIAGVWILLYMLILLTDLIDESTMQHSIRVPECKVCHSPEYIQVHLCLSF